MDTVLSTMLSDTELTRSASQAVELASRITRSIQSQIGQTQALCKDDRSPVTIADYASQAVIIHQLNQQFPDIPVVGEESARLLREASQKPVLETLLSVLRPVWPGITEQQLLEALDAGNHDASAARFWTLDPVDGTKGFLRGGHYAISLALIEQGQVQLGILGCPQLASDTASDLNREDADGVLFAAVADQGCWSRAINSGDAFQACSAGTDHPAQLRFCESVEAAHSDHDWSRQLAKTLGCDYQSIQIDSQCKYGVVARGQADAYLRLPTTVDYQEKIWDHAAGMLIAEEAGLTVSDIHGKRLDFSQGMYLSANRGIVCAEKSLHERLIDCIARHSMV